MITQYDSRSWKTQLNVRFRLILILACVTLAYPAFGQVSVSITQEQGLFVYDYTLTNEGTNLLTGLDISTPSVVSFNDPSGWVGTFAFGQLSWSAVAIPGIAQGDALSGFTVRSKLAPDDTQYSVFDQNYDEQTGTIKGPIREVSTSTTPEPSFIILLAAGGVTGFIWLALSWYRKRRLFSKDDLLN